MAQLFELIRQADGKPIQVKRHRVRGPETVIGRHHDCEVVIPLPSVALRHARVFRQEDDHFLEDLGTPSGTVWNSDFLRRRPQRLQDWDLIQVYQTRFVFRTADEDTPDWNGCDNHLALRAILWWKRKSARKVILFCCGHAWDLERRSVPSEPYLASAVETLELFADGGISREEADVRLAVELVNLQTSWEADRRQQDLVTALRQHLTGSQVAVWGDSLPGSMPQLAGTPGAVQAQAAVCVFGDLFYESQLDPAWLQWHDGLVRGLARTIYKERRFGDMPVLADALEDAGCQDPAILGHCRRGRFHTRGCWVLDLLLGKS